MIAQSQHQVQPQLIQYIQDLRSPAENKFKAKVVYTLTCINNLIGSEDIQDSNIYTKSNLSYLAENMQVLSDIASIHPTDPHLLYYVIHLLKRIHHYDPQLTQINQTINALIDNNVLDSSHPNILSSDCN